MKQEIIKKREVIDKVVVSSCDFCGREAKTLTCVKCGKDVCGRCGVYFDWDSDMLNPSSSWDYPWCMCKDCWNATEDVRKEIHELDVKREELFNKLGRGVV